MNLFTFVFRLRAPKAFKFKCATKNPLEAQWRVLREFLHQNKNTEYGQHHSFETIQSIREYQKRVPINTHETLRPYIRRMMSGGTNILTAQSPTFFSVTSGTTGLPKFIPVTPYSKRKKLEVLSLWIYHVTRAHPRAFGGKILVIVSPDCEGRTKFNIPYGSETGHGYKSLPRVAKRVHVLPYQIFTIKDYTAKYYCILRISMEHDIRSITTMNPSTILLLCQKVGAIQEKVIDDIRHGTLRNDIDIEPDIRGIIEESLQPNPRRADELESILAERGELLPQYFWPRLELIACWKAGTVGRYLNEFPQYFGDVPIRDMGYVSSEARCSIPVSDEGAGGILAISSNFYEFFSRHEREREREHKNMLLCNQLQIGKEYCVVVTTPGGLYRYNIDDIIRVVDFYNKTPVIEFVQKGNNVSSLTGEKIYESQVVEAVDRTVKQLNLSIQFCTASVQWGVPPRYIFLVEFIGDVPRPHKEEFLKHVEHELCDINIEYMSKRKSQRLGDPLLKVVCTGGFERYRIKKIDEGMHDSQFKMPELAADFNFQNYFKIQEEISIDGNDKPLG